MAAVVAGLLLGSPVRAAGEGGLQFWLGAVEPIVAPAPVALALVRLEDGALIPVGTPDLSSDVGELVALRSSDTHVLPLLFVPPPGHTGPVTLRAGGKVLRLQLDPSLTGRVEVTVTPRTMTKAPDASAKVTVRVFDAAGAPVDPPRPPVVGTNVGSVGEVSEVGRGVFEATYRPGKARYPEVAIISAFHPWPYVGSPAFAVGYAALPLSAAIELPGKTRPNVEMTIRIAGQDFGPVPSDAQGRFRVPVVVPPGHGDAISITVDKFGNRRKKKIDLGLPPTNRLAVTAHPTVLVADGYSRTQLVVFAVDRFGAPAKRAKVLLSAQRGRVTRPVRQGDGSYRAWYVAPASVGDGTDRISVRFPGPGRSRGQVEITLVSGRLAAFSADISPSVLVAPSEGTATIRFELKGVHGSPADVLVEATALRGRVEAPVQGKGSVWTAVYAPPSSADGWTDQVTVKARPVGGTIPAFVAVDAAADLLVVVDAAYRPVGNAVVTLAGERHDAAPDGTLPRPDLETFEVRLPGSAVPQRIHQARDTRGVLHGFPSVVIQRKAEVEVVLMEPAPVVVEAEVKVTGRRTRLSWKVIGGDGEREVVIAVGDAALLRRQGRTGTETLEAPAGVGITVTDVGSGVSAATRVPGE